MVYTNSSLVSKTQLSPKYNPRKYPITKITIHHAAGCMSMENLLNYVATTSRNMSCNYVLSGGKLGLCVEEKNRAWTSSNAENDHKAVTIEVANSSSGGNWPISDVDLEMLIKWCADVCKRNSIPKLYYDGTPNGSLTLHEMFSATGCPEAFVKSKIDYICDSVNAILNPNESKPVISAPVSDKYEVVTDLWGYMNSANAVNDVNRVRKVKAGTYYVFNETSGAVNVTVKSGVPGAWVCKAKNVKDSSAVNTPKESLESVARAVIRGEWGNGDTRIKGLTAAGYNADSVQAAVNAILKGQPIPDIDLNQPTTRKTVDEIANEVLKGLWGNGKTRKKKLVDAGYDYAQVQSAVNKLLR